jgi:hypothetical protein
MTLSLDPQPRGVPDASIPVIDLGPSCAGVPGVLEATAAALRNALETIGFCTIIKHGIAQAFIDRTVAEAKRFHEQPLDAKMALGMNEHNNGYMAMGQHAVWTSEVNTNDQPDLNEAFFVTRERRPDDPPLRSGRRFVEPNPWPSHLPGCRETALESIEAVDALGCRLLPVCAVTLDLGPDAFDQACADRQCSFRLSHDPPVPAKANRFGIAPHTDANFLTVLAPTDGPGVQVRAVWRLARGALSPRSVCRELRGYDGPLDPWPVHIDAASRPAARGQAPLCHPLLPRTPDRYRDGLSADVPRAREPTDVSRHHLRAVPALVVRGS